jgi:hypothetical protein
MNHAVNWEAISAIGQIVGTIAIVISPIYLATEVRRNTRASQKAAIRSTSDAYTSLVRSTPRSTHDAFDSKLQTEVPPIHDTIS